MFTSVRIELTKPHDPDQFYLGVAQSATSSTFSELVLAKAKPTISAEPITMRRLDFQPKMYTLRNSEIEGLLGGQHLFEETEVCWIIAEMISKQPKGEMGELYNWGSLNLFFTASCIVAVRWSNLGKWEVLTWVRSEDGRCSASQAFSRN